MIHSIALRELFPAGSLFLDCWEGSGKFTSLVPRHFRAPGAFAEQRDLVSARRYDRKAVGAVLQEQNLGFGAGAAAMANIARLSDPRSMVVVGGQQAGLFGGPLYTVHKALTILLLSRRLEAELGQPVIPVFWIASEDSDLAEVDRAFVTDADGGLRELRLPGDEAAKLPVSLVKLGGGLPPLLQELAAALAAGEIAPSIIEDLGRAYTPDRSYPQSFGAWMASLFRDQGLVLVDPSDVRLKRVAMPLFEREITEKSPVSRAVIEQTRLLVTAGYSPQIELREGMLTLFHQNPSRNAIAVKESGFELRSDTRKFSNGDLAALLSESPEQFTPNAVLRPLYQDSLFPTLAVVLGPSEIAYFSQLPLAYKGMGIPMPVVFPRASLTLVEPRMQRLLSKFDLTLRDVISRGERVIDDIVRRQIPRELFDRISAGRAQSARHLERHRGEYRAPGPHAPEDGGARLGRKRESVRLDREEDPAGRAKEGRDPARTGAAAFDNAGAPGRPAGADPHRPALPGALWQAGPGPGGGRHRSLCPRAPGRGDRRMSLDILAFGAHPDDVELAASGTLIRAARGGASTGVITLTRGEMGTRGTVETRSTEFDAASSVMALSHHEMLCLPDGRLAADEPSRMAVVREIREHRPRVVLLPWPEDRHPDHGAASQIVKEAAFLAGLHRLDTSQEPYRPAELVYYMSSWEFEPSFVVDISDFIEEKSAPSSPTEPRCTAPDMRAATLPRSLRASISRRCSFHACRTTGTSSERSTASRSASAGFSR